jgi:hypothetical protein
MPFDDSLLTAKVKGKDLVVALENPEAVYDGAAKKDGKWTVKGKPLDPAATYSVVTFEYLYFGGDNFQFAQSAQATNGASDCMAIRSGAPSYSDPEAGSTQDTDAQVGGKLAGVGQRL